ncbi:MAG: amidohydrolase family protein [bacterium]|nr:amidohydrolase family protein [bacterium]
MRLVLPLLLGGILYLVFKQLRSRQTAMFGGGVLLLIGLVLLLTKTPPFMIFGPLFDQPHAYVPETVGQAKAELRRQQEWDVDGVKVYDGLTEEQYLATVAEAKRRGMYVTGHILNQMPLDEQLVSGIDEIVHIDEFLSPHWIGYNLGNNPDPAYAETFNFPPNYEAIPQTAALVAENDIAVVSNLSADEAMYRIILDTEGTLAGSEYDVARPDLVETWQTTGRHKRQFANAGEQRRDVEMPFFMTLIKAFHDSGTIIILGTDAGGLIPEGSIPGHIHREVELLVEAGFSNYDALAAGTKNAGIIVERMGRGGNFGTIEVGQRADILLLTANPLENVSATRDRSGVMTNGRWYTQADLDTMLEEYMASREW